MKVINFRLYLDNVEKVLSQNSDCEYLHVHHEVNFKKDDENLITEARRDPRAKIVLTELANKGFYLYMTKDNKISSFVHHKALSRLWSPIRNKDYYFDNDLVYSIENPTIINNVNLLVVFSSISDKLYQSSLHRYFTKNFQNISKYINPNTVILRIADIGGITGAYYLDNKYIQDNESKIQHLISKISLKYEANKVILFGVSKGGSGALYHGVLGNYDFVAVDPILDDELYLTKHKDLHFVEGISTISKAEKFRNLLTSRRYALANNGSIITSENSPQFSYIEKAILQSSSKEFSIFVNNDPAIQDHPDVAPKSLFLITTLINNSLNNIYVEKKMYKCI